MDDCLSARRSISGADAFGVYQPYLAKVEVNLRFPGQYYDSHSGLYYNHNRYYSPKLGRYIEPDPIGLEGGMNPYAYAGNDPVNLVDPSGLLYKLNDVRLSSAVAYNEQNFLNYSNPVGFNTVLSPVNNQLISANKSGNYSAGVQIVTSDPVAYERISESYAKLNRTPAGRAITGPLEESSTNYTIHVTNKDAYSCSGVGGKCGHANAIYVDPYNSIALPTSSGYQPTSLAVILGHEFGHQRGAKDDGKNNMNNVNLYENPVRSQLGIPKRTAYNVSKIKWTNVHIR